MSLNFVLAYPTYPFYAGVGVSTDVPALIPVSLGGHAYMTDTPQIRRETLDVLRPAIDMQGEPGQHSLNTAGVWTIIGNDWRHGAGQIFFDSRDSDPRMFRTCKGMDPWTRERLSMLPDTHQILSATAQPLRLVSIQDELWAAGNGVLSRTVDGRSPAPTWSTVTVTAPLTGASLVDATTDGGRIYTAHGGAGVGRAAKGASSISQWSTYPATKVWYANGRLFAYKPGELVELDGAGIASTPIWTGGLGGDGVVVSVVGSPACVFIAYNTTDRGEVLCLGLNATTGALAVPLFAGQLNKGETFNELVYYQNLVLAATSRGLRLGTLTNSGRTVEFGPVLPLGVIGGAATFGQYAWMIWNDYDETSNGLGRVDLSTFTETLVPAYASDLMVDNALGMVGHLVTHQGQPFFTVIGAGVFTQHPSTLVTHGELHTGFMRMGTFERKVAVSMDVRHDPLNGVVSVGLCDEFNVEMEVGVSDVRGSLGPFNELSSSSLIGEALEVCLHFHPDLIPEAVVDDKLLVATGGTDKLLVNPTLTDRLLLNVPSPVEVTPATGLGPVLRRWTLRAMNIGWRTDAIELPLHLRSSVSTGTGVTLNYDTLAEWEFLKSLEAARTVVTLVMGDRSESVVIDKVGLKPERWLDRNHWFEGTTIVRLLTIDQAGG
jgi:hypothetical protein